MINTTADQSEDCKLVSTFMEWFKLITQLAKAVICKLFIIMFNNHEVIDLVSVIDVFLEVFSSSSFDKHIQ